MGRCDETKWEGYPTKGQAAYELRAEGKLWDSVAEILGGTTDSCVIGARKYAHRSNRPWPIPNVDRERRKAQQESDDARIYEAVVAHGVPVTRVVSTPVEWSTPFEKPTAILVGEEKVAEIVLHHARLLHPDKTHVLCLPDRVEVWPARSEVEIFVLPASEEGFKTRQETLTTLLVRNLDAWSIVLTPHYKTCEIGSIEKVTLRDQLSTESLASVYHAIERHASRHGLPIPPRNPERAYLLRKNRLPWARIAQILGYRYSNHAIEAARSHAETHNLEWPLPGTEAGGEPASENQTEA